MNGVIVPRLKFVLPVLVAALWADVAASQPTMVFVSATNGNDSNVCSDIKTPCLTAAGGLGQVSPGGKVTIVTSGSYGPMVINKSVTVEAAPGVAAVLDAYQQDVVSIWANSSASVVLRNLRLSGGGSGVVAQLVGSLTIEGCVIEGTNWTGVHFETAGNLIMRNTTVRRSGLFGVLVFSSPSNSPVGMAVAVIDGCQIDANVDDGVHVQDGGRAIVTNSTISGNGSSGVNVQNAGGAAPPEVTIQNCNISNNTRSGVWVIAHPQMPALARISSSVLLNNHLYGLQNNNGGKLYSRGDNLIKVNDSGDTVGPIADLNGK